MAAPGRKHQLLGRGPLLREARFAPRPRRLPSAVSTVRLPRRWLLWVFPSPRRSRPASRVTVIFSLWLCSIRRLPSLSRRPQPRQLLSHRFFPEQQRSRGRSLIRSPSTLQELPALPPPPESSPWLP